MLLMTAEKILVDVLRNSTNEQVIKISNFVKYLMDTYSCDINTSGGNLHKGNTYFIITE